MQCLGLTPPPPPPRTHRQHPGPLGVGLRRLACATLLASLLPAAGQAQVTRLQGLAVEPLDRSLQVSWTAATDAPGGYLVRWRVQQKGSSFISSQAASGTSYAITGLENGTPYVVRVDKLNANGRVIRGGQAAVAATPLADLPTPFANAPQQDPPQGLQEPQQDTRNKLTTPTVTLIVGDTWLRAIWPANIGTVASSELQWKAASVQSWTAATGVTTVTGTSVKRTGTNIIGLTTGTAYQVRVRDKAVMDSPDFADSDWSSPAEATPKGIPAPTGLVVEDEEDTALTLRWTPPADNRFTGYEINQDDSGWEQLDASMDSTDVRITGLTNEQSYSFRLRAVRAVDRRNLQDEVVEILGAAKILGAATPAVSGMPGTRPRAPEMLTAEAGNGQVKLTWEAPSFGGTPTGYEISSDGGKTWTATSTALSHTVMDLTNGQAYVFLVRAVNAIGTGPPSGSASATPRAVPAAPTGLAAAAGNGEVKLTWTAHPEGVTLLRFEYTTDSGTTWTAIEGNPVSKVSHVVTGLTNDQEYTFRLRVVNSVGNSAASTAVKATPTATGDVRFPAPVTGLTVTATAQRELTASWMVASHAPGGYELRWRKVSDFRGADSDKVKLMGTDTSHKITGLDPGTDYIVAIVTLDSSSAEVSDTVVDKRVATLDAPTLTYPALPTVLRAGVAFETLTPTPAGFESGSTYTYAVTTGDLPSGLELDGTTGAISGKPNTPKDTRTPVTVTVTGTTGTGMSQQTETATATLDFPRIFRFKLPAPTVTLARGDAQLTANWEAVADADAYALQWKASTTSDWSGTGVTTVDPATPGTVITGLTNGDTYDVRVRSKAASASTTHIDGDWSSAVQGAPTDTLNKLTTPTVTLIVGDTWLRAIWPANIGTVASSELQWKASTVMGWSGTGVTTVTSAKRTGTNIIGLTTGTAYEVRVRDKAVTDSPDFADSAWSSPVRATPKGIPAPTGLVVEDEEDTALTLRWTPPADTRFTGYEINQDDSGWEPLDASMDSTDVRITGLTNEQSYSFRLRAVRAVDRRNLQDEVVEILGAAKILGAATPAVSGMPGTRPRAPEMLTAEAGNGQVKLTWEAPSFGGTPTGYEISSDGGKTWTATSTALSHTVMYLTNGQAYVFLVRAVNAIGTGPPSGSASATPRAVPAAPTGLAAAAGNGEVKLTWTAHPEGVTLLRFEYTTDSGTTWTAIEGNPVSKVSHVVTGLTNDQEYTFRLRVVNSVGNSAASTAVKATPTATGDVRFPAPVTGLTVTATAQRELTASWMVASHAPGGYELRWRKVSDFRGADSDKVKLMGTDTSHKITGLDPGTDYIVAIVTLDSSSAEVSDTVVDKRVATLDAPTLTYPALPTVLRAGVAFETLTPTPAGFESGSTYTYAVTTGDLPSGLELDGTTGAISGKPNTPKDTRTPVTVTVTGTTGTGMSQQTETATATLDFPRIFRFKLPAPTVTLARGDAQLTANWEAVADADAYALQWKASTTSDWSGTGVTTVDPATPGTVITGLTNGDTYDVRVRSKAASASTTHIDGDWSSAVQGAPTDVTSLVAPTGLTATPLVNGLTATWTAVPGATGYKAYAGGSSAYQVTGTTAVFLFLSPDFTHTVSVIATANGLPDSPAAVLENQQPGSPPQGDQIEAIWINDAPRDRTGTFQADEKIQIAIDFKMPIAMDTAGGRPTIGLTIGDTVKQVALFKSWSQDNALYANYWVKAADRDTDGISIAANAIKLNGGKITSASDTGTPLDLSHAELPHDPNRKVNGGRDTNPNAPSDISLTGSAYASLGTSFDLIVSATDADGDDLFYYASLPVRNTEVLTVTPRLATKTLLDSGTSKVRVTPQRAGRKATFTVTVQDDALPRKYNLVQFEVFVAGLSYPAAPTELTAGASIAAMTPTTTHFESGSMITYAVTGGALPTGLSLDTGTGVISGQPTNPKAFVTSVTVTATGAKDGHTQTATASITFPGIGGVAQSPQQNYGHTTTTPTKASNLQVVAADGQLWLLWAPAASAPNGYSVRWRERGPGHKLSPVNEVDGTAYDITGLENGKTYVVRVDTRNAADDGVQAGTRITATGTPSPTLSVGDAQGDEGDALEFGVTLSSASTREVRVGWRTEPGTAQAGDDYESGNGELTFAPGETVKTVQVQTLDDAHDDPGETFNVQLSGAQGATIEDGDAIGTINNADPMPAGWLAHFGRATAEQALDGITRRIAAPRTAGREGTLGGAPLGGGAALNGEFGNLADGPSAGGGMTSGGFNDGMAVGFDNGPGAGLGHGMAAGMGANMHGGFANGMAAGMGQGMAAAPLHAQVGRGMAFGDLLAASSFALVGRADGAGRSAALWGRGVRSSFSGMDGAASVDGTVTTATLGADYGGGRWLAGVALSRTEGEGGYRLPGAGEGRIRATLGTAIPYAALNASERFKLWAAAGGGSGALTLTPEGGVAAETGIDWRMAALGLRGDLLTGGSGPALAFVSDGLWSRTASDRAEASGAATSLAASKSVVSRLRLGLEGSWALPLGLTPKLEAGVRRDAGDAGSGFGVELGGGLAWNASRFGLSLDLSGRTLIASGAGGRKDSGFSAALGYDPSPANRRGLSLSLRQDVGGPSTGGLASLFAPDLPGGGFGSGGQSRWTTEVAYGLPAFGDRFTASPTLGYGAFSGGRDYSLGWRLEPSADAEGAPDLSLGLRATRRESVGAPPDHGIEVEIRARW